MYTITVRLLGAGAASAADAGSLPVGVQFGVTVRTGGVHAETTDPRYRKMAEAALDGMLSVGGNRSPDGSVGDSADGGVEISNEGIVFLLEVRNERFRHTYAYLLEPVAGPDGRIPVRILPICTMNVTPSSAGEIVRVWPHAFVRVPPMVYYSLAHPAVAWTATQQPRYS